MPRAHAAGPNARPLPTRIHFTDDGKPGAAAGLGGALYTEWDEYNNRYRPQWCRVLDFPLTVAADVSAAGVPHDDVLRGHLSHVGLGPKVLHARADGDDLDIEALIDMFVDLRSGYSPPEHVYLERRKLARNLGVLILLDASGSATDTDPDGLAVHDHQRRAAATLAATLEELGDRVAVYAFRSQGRHAVHLPAIKRSTNVSAPSDEPGSTSSNHRATRVWAPASAVQAKFSRHKPAHPIGCWSSYPMAFPTTTATKAGTQKPTPQKPSKNSAPTALPAFAFRSAPTPTPTHSNASSAPPAMPAPRPWPT
jgi:hypothetical protein